MQRPGLIAGPAGILEYDVIHTDGAERARHDGDVATVEADARPAGVRQERDTVQILQADYIGWVNEAQGAVREARMRHVIARVRAFGGLAGISDERAMADMASLCGKLAAADAERNYRQLGVGSRLLLGADGKALQIRAGG